MIKFNFTIFLLFLVLTDYQLYAGGQNIQKMNTTHNEKTEIDPKTSIASIYSNSKTLLKYTYDQSQFKPYVKELYTPEGLNVLLDSPDDHKHHHGLMFACKVDGINFWEEVKNSGRQESRNISDLNITSSGIFNDKGFFCDIQWMNPKTQQVLVYEKRLIKAESTPELQANIISWKSEFSIPASHKTVILSGAHYNGLGMRFLRSMDKDGRFLTADNQKGKIFRGQERLTPARWCAYLAQHGEKKVTIAMFGLSENPRGSTTWFTMKEPFAYLAATMKLHENPFTLEAGQPLLLRYGIALWDGHANAEKIEKTYQYWLTLVKKHETSQK